MLIMPAHTASKDVSEEYNNSEQKEISGIHTMQKKVNTAGLRLSLQTLFARLVLGWNLRTWHLNLR